MSFPPPREAADCPICMERGAAFALPCKHVFHEGCIGSWGKACPLCRRETSFARVANHGTVRLGMTPEQVQAFKRAFVLQLGAETAGLTAEARAECTRDMLSMFRLMRLDARGVNVVMPEAGVQYAFLAMLHQACIGAFGQDKVVFECAQGPRAGDGVARTARAVVTDDLRVVASVLADWPPGGDAPQIFAAFDNVAKADVFMKRLGHNE